MLPGGTAVSSVESSGRRLTFFRSVAQIGQQAAQGLAHAHARGIVHRDIKPSNLLLDTAGVVWITDFGLAKAEDDGLTATGDILGTLRYMPPERFRGEGDARADIYALGLTLYELLTLRPAFDAADRLKLIERIKAEEPARPRSLDGRIPRDLETIVLKAIEKEPEARYQSAEAMGEDLGRFLADEPIRARQVGAAERYWRWARRNPVIATLGGLLTALLIALTVGSIVAASYFKSLAGDLFLANQKSQDAERDARDAQKQALLERDHSRRQSAGLALDRGLQLCQEGKVSEGMLWMAESLAVNPKEDRGFADVVRLNLAAWRAAMTVQRTLIRHELKMKCVAYSPDGKTVATAQGDTVSRWDASTGEPAGQRWSTPGKSHRSPSARTADFWPRGLSTSRCGSGRWPPENWSVSRSRNPTWSTPSNSAGTAVGFWRPRAFVITRSSARRGSGKWPPASRPVHPWPIPRRFEAASSHRMGGSRSRGPTTA